MPLYEYKCQSCGKTFEVIQKFADEPLKTHPECGGIVERLFSAPAFHLKGTGWYATDYGKGNGKSAAAKSEDSKKSGDSKNETKTEKSDSATTSEAKSDSSSTSSSTESKPVPAT
ncbi:MAG: zinc ribbon domain-containing protein [Acidobacteriota bacterium]|nr:zinc ribbon domain-containing protein [Acidobacteriota bacterium]